MTTTYLHGITDTATHRVATGRTADQVEADAKGLALRTVTPDRWFPGDLVLLASRDGEAFTGEVADVCVTTGQVIVILNGDGPEPEPYHGGMTVPGYLCHPGTLSGRAIAPAVARRCDRPARRPADAAGLPQAVQQPGLC